MIRGIIRASQTKKNGVKDEFLRRQAQAKYLMFFSRGLKLASRLHIVTVIDH